ncbi:MAG: alpha-galactosidase, partial [Deltaproteobacteria bacterium]|nr:alpha-galactosidase [Deltaproteobacteria bacterium]
MSTAISIDRSLAAFLLTGLNDRPLPFQAQISWRADGSSETWNVNPDLDGQKTDHGWKGLHAPFRLQLQWETKPGGVSFSFSLRNDAKHDLYLNFIRPAIFQLADTAFADLDQIKMFQHGFQSWTPSQVVPATSGQQYPRLKSFALMSHFVDSPFWGRKDGLISSLFTVLKRSGTAAATLFGFTSQKTGLGELFLQNTGSPFLFSHLDYGGKQLRPGETLAGESLCILHGDVKTILEQYAVELGKLMGARLKEESPVGWCSWYEFYTKVTEKNLIEYVCALAEHPGLGVEVVQLDDGYQAAVGDWFSLKRKFPSGLKALTEKIHDTGFKAGIWLAPFFASS